MKSEFSGDHKQNDLVVQTKRLLQNVLDGFITHKSVDGVLSVKA